MARTLTLSEHPTLLFAANAAAPSAVVTNPAASNSDVWLGDESSVAPQRGLRVSPGSVVTIDHTTRPGIPAVAPATAPRDYARVPGAVWAVSERPTVVTVTP